MRSTYTYAICEVSEATYQEIRAKLVAAGYDHAFHVDAGVEVIDMHGIALGLEKSATDPAPPPSAPGESEAGGVPDV